MPLPHHQKQQRLLDCLSAFWSPRCHALAHIREILARIRGRLLQYGRQGGGGTSSAKRSPSKSFQERSSYATCGQMVRVSIRGMSTEADPIDAKEAMRCGGDGSEMLNVR